ncbi:MAG TPA: TetR/AcrR family transcriptional regulator [Casimicrobiaceae bacterium]|jgi:AcrR family transcriptional regulator
MPRDTTRPAGPPRDAEASRARILAAATAEFARHGLSGARVDRIAERAKANKRMLYYYYGGKETLFLAVLEAAYARIRGEEQKLDLTAKAPAEGMRELVTFTWRHFIAHPEFISLLNTENLHRAKHLKRSTRIRSLHSPLIATISDLLARGTRAGVFRAGIDPVQLYVSIAALGYFYLSNAYTLSTIFGRDLTAPKAKEERVAHVVDLVLGALAP